MECKIYKNYYLIYKDGRMYSLRSEKFLKQSTSPTGYKYYQISIGMKKFCVKVHRAVAEAFIANPENLKEVNHIDGDKSNNYVSNLEWCTRSLNIKHAYVNNLRCAKGVKNSRCVTTDQTVKSICELLQDGKMPSEIRDLGYKYSLVRKIRSRENWLHISSNYKW